VNFTILTFDPPTCEWSPVWVTAESKSIVIFNLSNTYLRCNKTIILCLYNFLLTVLYRHREIVDVDGIDEVEVRYGDAVVVVEEVEVIQALTYVNLDGKQRSSNHSKKISICRTKLSIIGMKM